MRALIFFDCFGVIFMTMIFTSFVRSLEFNCSVVFSESRFSISTPVKRRRFASVIAKSYPIRIVIQFSRCNEKAFHLFPLGSAELSGVFEKIFLNLKDPFTHLDKGYRNAHPFLRFSEKNFYLVKRPPHLFGITSLNDTLFFSKNEKIFFIRLQALYFACPEKAFSLIPTENSKMHTLNRKKFLSLHLFGIERSKRTLFFRKKAKKIARQHRRAHFR